MWEIASRREAKQCGGPLLAGEELPGHREILGFLNMLTVLVLLACHLSGAGVCVKGPSYASFSAAPVSSAARAGAADVELRWLRPRLRRASDGIVDGRRISLPLGGFLDPKIGFAAW